MSKQASSANDPFQILVATMISQNTNDKNAARAFENLSKKFRISPEILAEASIKDVEQSLRIAGLYRAKSRSIKKVSKTISERYNGDLGKLLSMSFEKARNELLQLSGVGPKTADVVLLFAAERPTVPVDTHVNRVSKRLGLAPKNGNYDAVRIALQMLFDRKDYLAVHLLLIMQGRKYCRARTPLCNECPLNRLCPSVAPRRK